MGNHDTEREQLVLRHVDLPKLDDAGFVDWERESGRISRGVHFDAVAAVLELFDDNAEDLPFQWPEPDST